MFPNPYPNTQYEKISQLKDGSILILAKDQTTADKFIQSKALDNICPVDIKLHANLNLSKGIVFAPCLVNVPETEIITELRSQNVTNVYKFTKLVQEKEKQIYIPSGLMIFTFDSFQIPETIEIGWYKTKVSEYVPNPMRCRQCQLLGHTIKWCKRAASCVTCNLPPHDDNNCIRTLCANCSGPQPASAKDCPNETPQKNSETNSDNEQIHTLNNYSRAQTKSNNGKTNINENTQTTASSSSNSINQITSLTNFSPLSHTNFSLNIDDKNDTSQ
ncbi:uncharacterized protein LOC129953615 [Eupeodes corollae]|uniref:uncharacterized protein LOC129953615 n=1 Tax=Eupeodes corollae TaxID=290404 RepID=UPI00249383E0|nr:uncharacterized protein LOC129953615 [Eupeodes corollae]